jgi:hypothetical protein
MQFLPLELKHLIVLELSSDSPSSLAALALTHTSYQREAEKALYDGLYIIAHRDESLKCMKTLATNLKKAALVRFLTIEYVYDDLANNRSVMTYLSKSIINMHTLSDIRIRSHPGDYAKTMKKGERLGKILWSVCKILILLKTCNLSFDSAGYTAKVIFA